MSTWLSSDAPAGGSPSDPDYPGSVDLESQKQRSEYPPLSLSIDTTHLLALLTGHLGELVWIADCDTEEVLYVTDAVPQMWELSREALDDDPRAWTGRLHVDDREEVVARFEAALRGEGDFDLEYRIMRDDGSIRWLHDRMVHRSEEDGRTIAVFIASDITRSKQRLHQMQLRSNQFAFAQRLAKVGDWKLNLETGMIEVSQETRRIYGLPEDREITIETAKSFTLPQYRPMLDKALDDTLLRHKPYDVRFEIERGGRGSGGEIRHIHSIAQFDNEARCVHGSIQDITDQVKREHDLQHARDLFETLTESASDYIVLLSGRKIRYHNDSLLRDLNLEASELGENADFLNLIAPEERDRMSELIARGEDDTLPTTDHQTTLLGRDGKRLRVEMRARNVIHQREACVLAILRNIEERHSTEEARRLAKQVVDSLPIGLFIYQYLPPDQLVLLSTNDEAEKLTGIREKELAGAEFNSIFDRAEELGITGQFLEVARTKTTLDFNDMFYSDSRLHGYYRIRVFALPNDRVAVAFDDVTGEVEVKQHLQRSQRRFRALFEGINEAVFVHTPGLTPQDAVLLEVNQVACRRLGFSREQLLGKTFSFIDNTDPKSLGIDDLGERLQRGETVMFESVHRTADGDSIPVEVRINPATIEGETVLVSVARDISERRQAEEAMRERSEFEHLLLDLSTRFINLSADTLDHEITTALGRIGRFRKADRSYVFQFDDASGTMSNTHEWCAPGISAEMDNLQQVPVEALPWWMERMYNDENVNIPSLDRIPEDAPIRSLLESQSIKSILAVPMHAQGKLIGFLGFDAVTQPRHWPADSLPRVRILADIFANALQRRRTEFELNRLAMAIEQSAETVLVTDRDGTIEYANPAAQSTSGYSRDELVGKNPRILKSGRHDQAFYEEMWSTLMRGEVWKGVFTNRRKNGSLFHEAAVISPVTDRNGQVINYVVAKQDITERVRLEEQLRQAQKMEAVGNLAGGIAHDFNNLLTVITGNVELLLYSLDPKSAIREEIEEIGNTAERAADLTRQLLSFSRKQVLQPATLVINTVIQNAKRLLHNALGEHNMLAFDLAPDLWTTYIDPVQLDQILLNLTVNARDAMRDCGGTLMLRTANVPAHQAVKLDDPDIHLQDYVLLEVRDTGVGMSQETVSRIFEPFFTTKETGKGTGLGLATVYGIVKQSLGSIRVTSRAGEGTTFSIYLPRDERSASGKADQEAGSLALHGTETILIVEDEDLVRRSAAKALRHFGYTVLEAEDGQVALDLFEDTGQVPDIIVTDLVMPRMNGPELIDEIQRRGYNRKVVFMSGYSADVLDTKDLQNGAHFLQKPFRPKEFIRVVRSVLDEET